VTFPKAKVGLDPGRLRHRVEIQKQRQSRDSEGGVVVAWEKVATVWAGIEPLSAREKLMADQVQSELVARIVIRYMDGIDSSMRIKHGSKVYNIAGVIADNETMMDWLTLPVSLGPTEG